MRSHPSRPRRSRRSGHTLIEMASTLVLTVVVGGAVGMATDSSSKTVRVGSAVAKADLQVQKALQAIKERLRTASFTTVTPTPAAPFHSNRIEYQRVTGYGAGGVEWGPPEAIELELDPREALDGADNDGDGLVDECQVVAIENPGLAAERRSIVCRNVRAALEGEILGNGVDDNFNGLEDEPGLAFDFDGSRVTLNLSMEHTDPNGQPIVRTLSSTLNLREIEP